jgi:hypothetical protein
METCKERITEPGTRKVIVVKNTDPRCENRNCCPAVVVDSFNNLIVVSDQYTADGLVRDFPYDAVVVVEATNRTSRHTDVDDNPVRSTIWKLVREQ